MPTPAFPGVSAVLSRLREVFGPEMEAGPGLARWWVHGVTAASGVAIWMRTAPAPCGPCEVWVTRPFEDQPERCPVVSLAHLDAFIARVRSATRAPAPAAVKGTVCPPAGATA